MQWRVGKALRLARWVGATALLLIVLGLLSFAIPVPEWRTGELPAAPLPVVEGGPAVAMPKRVWIDTDAACGHGRKTDPDDCLAILLLLESSKVEIVGISTVHGNAPLEVTDRITRALVQVYAHHGKTPPPIYRGVPEPVSGAKRAGPAPALRALRHALADGPLTLVSLGPLSNIALALKGHPEPQRNVARLVAVMGRRPGHLFHPAEGAGDGMLFGHGPVFRDFNFAKDPVAARVVLDMGLPTTLAPYDAARDLSLTGRDLAVMAQAGGAAAWVARRAGGWLDFWKEDIGRDGFYPFDALAAAYVLEPGLLDCARTFAWIAEDRKLWDWLTDSVALLVGPANKRPARVLAAGRVVYCPRVDPRLQDWLVSRLD